MDCPNCEAMDWPSLPDGTYTCSVCHQTYYLRTSGARTAPPQITHHCPTCEATQREMAELRAKIAALAKEMDVYDRNPTLRYFEQKLRALLAQPGAQQEEGEEA